MLGAIYSGRSLVRISGSLFEDNVALKGGGAVFWNVDTSAEQIIVRLQYYYTSTYIYIYIYMGSSQY